MKIEVELEEVERLRKTILNLENALQESDKQLGELRAKRMQDKAIRMAWRLFNNYMNCVFRKLGFDQSGFDSAVQTESLFTHWLGDEWYTRDERIDMKIGAKITNQFRNAYLGMGVITQSEEKQIESELELE